MFKETPESLRLYFVFCAAYQYLPMTTAAAQGRISGLVSLPMLVNFTVAVLFIYVAIRFKRLLRNPTPILVILVATWTLSAINFALSLRTGAPTVAEVVGFTLSVLIVLYLMKSVTRLSKEVSGEKA